MPATNKQTNIDNANQYQLLITMKTRSRNEIVLSES